MADPRRLPSDGSSAHGHLSGDEKSSDTAPVPSASGASSEPLHVNTCIVCDGTDADLMFKDEPYSVLRCKGCTFVWVTPRIPDDQLHEVYADSYWESDDPKAKGYANYASDEPLYLKTFRRRSRLVERFVDGPCRILDVGCAAGFFLRVMQERGHDVRGVEVSTAIGQRARKSLGDERVFLGYLEDAMSAPGFEPGSFDLVTLWDVVEHVPDPKEFLRQVRSMLKPTGTLLLETQDIDSRFAKMLGSKWQHFKHEEHIYHFNRSTIERVLRDTGFEVLHNSPRFGGKYVSLGFIAERAGRLHRSVSWILKPLALAKGANIYVNFRDEMVVAAVPAPASKQETSPNTPEAGAD